MDDTCPACGGRHVKHTCGRGKRISSNLDHKLVKRPRGAAPKNKMWDGVRGEWVESDRTGDAKELSSIHEDCANSTAPMTRESVEHRKGDEVEARFRGGSVFYSGVVKSISEKGNYCVKYSDGDVEKNVRPCFVRKPVALAIGSTPSPATPATLATPATPSTSATLTTPATLATPATPATQNSATPIPIISLEISAPKTDPNPIFAKGDRALSRYNRGRGCYAYYYVKITKVCPPTTKNIYTTYNVVYEDGEKGVGVGGGDGWMLKPGREDRNNPTLHLSRFRITQRVEARYKGWSKWYPGVIVKENKKTGSFAIDYDDGTKEKNVKVRFMRPEDGDSDDDGANEAGGDFADREEEENAAEEQAEETETEEEDEEPTYCGTCGMETRHEEAHEVILCDGCEKEFHFGCVGILEPPEGDFFCNPCLEVRKRKRQRRKKLKEQEIIEEEIDDDEDEAVCGIGGFTDFDEGGGSRASMRRKGPRFPPGWEVIPRAGGHYTIKSPFGNTFKSIRDAKEWIATQMRIMSFSEMNSSATTTPNEGPKRPRSPRRKTARRGRMKIDIQSYSSDEEEEDVGVELVLSDSDEDDGGENDGEVCDGGVSVGGGLAGDEILNTDDLLRYTGASVASSEANDESSNNDSSNDESSDGELHPAPHVPNSNIQTIYQVIIPAGVKAGVEFKVQITVEGKNVIKTVTCPPHLKAGMGLRFKHDVKKKRRRVGLG